MSNSRKRTFGTYSADPSVNSDSFSRLSKYRALEQPYLLTLDPIDIDPVLPPASKTVISNKPKVILSALRAAALRSAIRSSARTSSKSRYYRTARSSANRRYQPTSSRYRRFNQRSYYRRY